MVLKHFITLKILRNLLTSKGPNKIKFLLKIKKLTFLPTLASIWYPEKSRTAIAPQRERESCVWLPQDKGRKGKMYGRTAAKPSGTNLCVWAAKHGKFCQVLLLPPPFSSGLQAWVTAPFCACTLYNAHTLPELLANIAILPKLQTLSLLFSLIVRKSLQGKLRLFWHKFNFSDPFNISVLILLTRIKKRKRRYIYFIVHV